MDPRHIALLQNCPYDLSRLLDIKTGKLEHATGKELMGMFLLAKQHGPLSYFKYLWSRRRVRVPRRLMEEQWITAFGSQCFPPSISECSPNTNESPLQDLTHFSSPLTDPSSSPNRCVARKRLLGNASQFSYYRFAFAGLDLPYLGIRYLRHKKTRKKICSYGGSLDDERCHLSSWEYEIVQVEC